MGSPLLVEQETLDGRERFTVHPMGQDVEVVHSSETQQIPFA